ncbi:hypothetical protein DFS33DRAFT_1262217, partial [Desarmillaria ectypa]
LLSNHLPALERMRWSEYGKPKVMRDHRKYRFCRTVIESPEHALLHCNGTANLIELRKEVWAELSGRIPSVLLLFDQVNDVCFLRQLIAERSTITLVAMFAYNALQIFYAAPMLCEV